MSRTAAAAVARWPTPRSGVSASAPRSSWLSLVGRGGGASKRTRGRISRRQRCDQATPVAGRALLAGAARARDERGLAVLDARRGGRAAAHGAPATWRARHRSACHRGALVYFISADRSPATRPGGADRSGPLGQRGVHRTPGARSHRLPRRADANQLPPATSAGAAHRLERRRRGAGSRRAGSLPYSAPASAPAARAARSGVGHGGKRPSGSMPAMRGPCSGAPCTARRSVRGQPSMNHISQADARSGSRSSTRRERLQLRVVTRARQAGCGARGSRARSRRRRPAPGRW